MPNAKKTLIPHVPDSLTYTLGTTVGVGVSAGSAELIADKIFHRSVIDKIRYGITARGLVDYFKTPGNLQFVTRKINDASNCLLQVKLSENKYMYLNVYFVNDRFFHVPLYKEKLSDVTIQDLTEGYKFYQGVSSFDCVLESLGSESSVKSSIVMECVQGLYELCGGSYKNEVKGTMFEGLKFSKKDLEYIESEMQPYVEKLSNSVCEGMQISKFKVKE